MYKRQEQIGLRYTKSPRGKIDYIVTGRLLDRAYTPEAPLSWDAVDGRPPEAAAQNEKTFRLYYLGMGQHVKSDGVPEAQSVEEALAALKNQLLPGEDIPDVAYLSLIHI